MYDVLRKYEIFFSDGLFVDSKICTISLGRSDPFLWTFSNNKGTLHSQLEDIVRQKIKSKSRAKENIDINVFVLKNKQGSEILTFNELPSDPEEILIFDIPFKIDAISANKWDESYLTKFSIKFNDITVEEFVGTSYVPSDKATNLIAQLSDLSLDTFDAYPNRNSKTTDYQAARDNNLLQHPLIKSVYLTSKFHNRESAVDSFVFILLYELGFFSGMLYAFPQLDIPLKFGSQDCHAIADFGILDIVSFYRMAVVEDKSVNNEVLNSEPQLLAEAIAAHQMNVELESSLTQEFTSEQEIDNIIYGVRVNGNYFSFYEIPISPSILQAMNYESSTNTDNFVKRVSNLNFLKKKERENIIRILEYLRNQISSRGIGSKRRPSH